LYPEQLGSIGVAAQDIGQSLQREWIKLLYSNDCHVTAPKFFALVRQIVVNLSRAQQQAANLASHELCISNDFLERSVGEFLEARCRLCIAEQELRRKNYQRLAYAPAIIAAVPPVPPGVHVPVPLVGEDDHQIAKVPRSMVVSIIRPRLEETFELVRERLEGSGLGHAAGTRVVLTGGAEAPRFSPE